MNLSTFIKMLVKHPIHDKLCHNHNKIIKTSKAMKQLLSKNRIISIKIPTCLRSFRTAPNLKYCTHPPKMARVLKLNNGTQLPVVGLGTSKVNPISSTNPNAILVAPRSSPASRQGRRLRRLPPHRLRLVLRERSRSG